MRIFLCKTLYVKHLPYGTGTCTVHYRYGTGYAVWMARGTVWGMVWYGLTCLTVLGCLYTLTNLRLLSAYLLIIWYNLSYAKYGVNFCQNIYKGLLTKYGIEFIFVISQLLSECMWRCTYNILYWLLLWHKSTFVKMYV